jgi:hypothetical protein
MVETDGMDEGGYRNNMYHHDTKATGKLSKRQKREKKTLQIIDDNNYMKIIINFPISLTFP